MGRAWTLISILDDRQYGGNLGYEDDPKRVYRYDSSVANHLRLSRGDLVFLRNRQTVLGMALVQEIKSAPGKKTRFRCPDCGTPQIKRRKRITPTWRCSSGHEFEEPTEETVQVKTYEARYPDSFVELEETLGVRDLKDAARKPNDQHSIEEVNPAKLKRRIVASSREARDLWLKFLPPIVFLHGINMTAYDGYETNIHAGEFKFAKKYGFGGEIYNFRNVNDRYYGHVEIMPRKIKGILTPISIILENLGASGAAPYLDDVLVIWTAPCRDGDGSEVVGWYRNATLHRHRVYPTRKLKRARKFRHPDTGEGYDFDYRVEAQVSDCRLLHPDERVLRIPSYPKSGKGVPGQFPVFYPLLTSSDEGREVSKRVLAFVNTGTAKPYRTRRSKKTSSGRQQDPKRRVQIETVAVKFVREHFGEGGNGLGYKIESREKENVGYDLLMTKGDVTLCVEVKGRSIDDVVADFSPNESRTIRAHQTGKFEDGDYRVCIVTDSLGERGKRQLHHFSWWPGKKKWIKVDGSEQLNFYPSGATRATLDPNGPGN